MPLKRLHYSWIMLIAGLGIAFTSSINNYSFGLFLKPLATDFNTTRAIISGARSVSGIVAAVAGIFIGHLTDKYGPRVMLLTTGIMSGLGFIFMSLVSAVWQIYLLYIIIGMVSFQVPLYSTLPRWFAAKRDLALGIVQSGFGVGGLILVPLVQSFITNNGWRQSYLFIGLLSLCIISPLALLLKHSPQRAGMQPYGSNNPTQKKPAISDTNSLNFPQAIKTARFWIFGLLLTCFMFALSVIEVHIAPYATDIKIPAAAAATVVAFVSGFGILGKISVGFVSGKTGVRIAVVIYLTIVVLSLLQLLLVQGTLPLYLFAVIFGLGYGGIITIIPSVTAELFGLKYISVLYGAVMCFGTAGRSIGPIIAGDIFDRTGSYHLAFIICLILSIIAITLSLVLYSRRPRNQAAPQ